jgi:hypothetical protein
MKKLTGWLILLIVWIVLGGINGLGDLGAVAKTWKPHMAEYPGLQTAVLVFQGLTGAGIIAWLYAGWVLYQRQPGTLSTAQRSLLVGGGLRVVGSWSIMLLGGLPASAIRVMASQVVIVSVLVFAFTSVWYLYLARSQKVRELYAD